MLDKVNGPNESAKFGPDRITGGAPTACWILAYNHHISNFGGSGPQNPKISPFIGKCHQNEKLNNFLTVRDGQKVLMEHK